MSDQQVVGEKRKLDLVGIVAGFLCAAHCLIASTAPIWISVLGVGSIFSRTAEIIFVLFGITTAVFTIWFGVYGASAPKIRTILTVGILALLLSQYLEMNTDHHGHHEDDHHQAHTSSLVESESDDTHHNEHNSEEEEHSRLPLLLSVFGGLMIVTGHAYNLLNHQQTEFG